VFWDPGSTKFKSGQVIDALTEDSEFAGEHQLNVKAARVVDDDPGELFLPRTSYSIDGLYEELNKFVAEITSEPLRKLLELAVIDPRWKRTPAAKQIHHAVIGGLLEHVTNLCRLAYSLAVLYPKLKRDLLVTAAILHDIGKQDELSNGVTIEYTLDGEILGHIVIGLLRVDKWMDELKFNDELRRTVRHLIISHHGSPQYGSPKSPMILEAQVFNNMDGIDANIGKITAAIEKAGPDKEWSDKVDWKDRFYLGPTGLEK